MPGTLQAIEAEIAEKAKQAEALKATLKKKERSCSTGGVAPSP